MEFGRVPESDLNSVDFSLPESGPVTISLHSIKGDRHAIIANNDVMQKGFYSMQIDLSSAKLSLRLAALIGSISPIRSATLTSGVASFSP